MIPPSLPAEPDAPLGKVKRAWLPAVAFAFVLFSLVALVAIPTILLGRITRAAEQVTTTILPANDALRELALAMEERVTSARSRFISDDPRYDIRLEEAAREEEEALRALGELAPRFGIETNRYFESLRRYTAGRDSIEFGVIEAGERVEAYRAALPKFDAVRDSIRVQLTEFREELIRVALARAADEARWAELQRMLSLVLGTMAVVAALLVGWFALGQRRLTLEVQAALDDANRQRAIAERRGDELERATETRARLLRGVTHDVKNPLGAAKGFTELLEMGIKGPLLPEQVPLLQGVTRSIDNALGIIADLLDLARADSGGLTINRVETDLRTVIREAAEGHRPAAEATGHEVDVQIPEEPVNVYTDSGRVSQILGNLLSNAVKYTSPPGRISVRCFVHTELHTEGGEQAPEKSANVVISDTGPGIPIENREAIFDEFTRLDDRGAQKGNGLGLAIARRVARLLGGDLTAEEAPTGGAAFVLRLPLRHADESDPDGPDAERSGVG